MSKLLSAGFVRLRKSRIFWILFLLMTALGIYIPVGQYLDMKKYGYTQTLDNGFFSYIMCMGVIIAVFISLFLGTEYSDGTIRNKLVVGHSRISIYFSNLILCVVAGLAISVGYMAACACVGIPLFGFFDMGLKMAAILILSSLVISIAYTSIFTLAAMLIHNKAVLAVVTIITAFLMLFATTYLYSMLSQPEMRTDYIINENGQVEETKPVPNEFYVSGTKREVYEFLMEFLPPGQNMMLLSSSEPPLFRILMYDCIIVVVTTGLGIFGFLKKDIK